MRAAGRPIIRSQGATRAAGRPVIRGQGAMRTVAHPIVGNQGELRARACGELGKWVQERLLVSPPSARYCNLRAMPSSARPICALLPPSLMSPHAETDQLIVIA
jgi:hypothetical protein